jgi:CsoR family transcriptional regulator, copper-sensing transcriptional repressor
MAGGWIFGGTLMPKTQIIQPNQVSAAQTKIIHRLRRLEGQVRGLQKMVEDTRDCKEILTQLSGARAALDAVGEMILEAYLEDCQAKMSTGESNISSVIQAVRLLRK